MGRRAPRNSNVGRRSLLTRERADQITELVRAGNYVETAALATGIARSTIWQWLQQGRDAADAIAAGETVTPQARRYAQFAEALQRARAEAEVRVIGTIHKVIEGGYVLEEEPVMTSDGLPVYADGELAYRRKYAPPDGKLALEYLARTRPDRYGRNPEVQVDISAPGTQVESGSLVGALADRLAAVVAERRREIEAVPEDIEDAEVVDDGAA
jgi:hypothetical protein